MLLSVLLVAEILVVTSAKRLDYVDFFEERKKETKLVSVTKLMNATTTKTHPPSNSREANFT
jgi:hypothetical protein